MFIHYCGYLCFARDMGSRIYIGRLPYRAQERDIEKFFKGYGKVRDIMLKNGYGFVVRILFPFCFLSFERIRFKLALLLYKACTNHLPSYLSSMVTPFSSVEGCSSLRSASGIKYVVHGTRLVFGGWSLHLEFPTTSCPKFSYRGYLSL